MAAFTALPTPRSSCRCGPPCLGQCVSRADAQCRRDRRGRVAGLDVQGLELPDPCHGCRSTAQGWRLLPPPTRAPRSRPLRRWPPPRQAGSTAASPSHRAGTAAGPVPAEQGPGPAAATPCFRRAQSARLLSRRCWSARSRRSRCPDAAAPAPSADPAPAWPAARPMRTVRAAPRYRRALPVRAVTAWLRRLPGRTAVPSRRRRGCRPVVPCQFCAVPARCAVEDDASPPNWRRSAGCRLPRRQARRTCRHSNARDGRYCGHGRQPLRSSWQSGSGHG